MVFECYGISYLTVMKINMELLKANAYTTCYVNMKEMMSVWKNNISITAKMKYACDLSSF